MMTTKPTKGQTSRSTGLRSAEAFRALSQRILESANLGTPREDFLKEVALLILDFSGCDQVELRLKEAGKLFRGLLRKEDPSAFRLETLSTLPDRDGRHLPCLSQSSALEDLCRKVCKGQTDSSLPFFTKAGSFWTGDAERDFARLVEADGRRNEEGPYFGWEHGSLALIPLVVGRGILGLVQLRAKPRDFFNPATIAFLEDIAQMLGIALAHRFSQAALRERVKELTCLYGIARLAGQQDLSLEEILEDITKLLPPAMLYPESALARIILQEKVYQTGAFQEGNERLEADILLDEKIVGRVEVSYRDDKPARDEGPFLKEERDLVDAVAREIALILEQKQAEAEQAKLQEQLMHADRLATIGQLAAGVAHELSEPLGSILGFAQLIKKNPGLPPQAKSDIDKIEAASLHAREVVRKLLIFARQMPTKKTRVNLNKIVDEGLYILGSRCSKEGIELIRFLSPDLPEITADPAQLTQVLINLVVNAIQAMPNRGKLTISTRAIPGQVSLIVEDTGTGISEEVKKKLFLPFFTTKALSQGTGLGLPVVHGIVAAHGGTIDVDSEVGRGSRFEIRLPAEGIPKPEDKT
jgi:two-component system NtrC family sensor kinase